MKEIQAGATLRRTLSVWHVSLTGIGVILGAGVYALIGPAAALAGSGLWMAFGPEVGFVAGWLMLVGDIAAAASVALGFGGYLGHLLGTPMVARAAALVLVAAVAMYAGIGQSVAVAAILTAVEVVGLLVVIAVGLPSWPQIDFRVTDASTGIFDAAALIFFAYLGFDELGPRRRNARS